MKVEHVIPEPIRAFVKMDLEERCSEAKYQPPVGASLALSTLAGLPAMHEDVELEIIWSSVVLEPAGATFHLTASRLTLSVEDEDGFQEIYECEAGYYPRIDQDDFEAWIRHCRCLDDPQIAISHWGPRVGNADR